MLKSLFNWYFSRLAAPYWVVLVADIVIVYLSGIASFALVQGLSNLWVNFGEVLLTWLILLPGYIAGMRLFHTYSGVLRYSSATDLSKLICALLVGTAVAIGIHFVINLSTPANVYNITGPSIIVAFMMATIICLGLRMVIKYIYNNIIYDKSQQRAFVYGVHEGGQVLAKSINSDPNCPYVLSGFITDDEKMVGHRLMGLKVYWVGDSIVEKMRIQHICALFVSPTRAAHLSRTPELLNKLVQNNIKIMMKPAELQWDGKSSLTVSQMHEVEIEDLLSRDKIEVNIEAIGQLLKDRVVLITGAAGSIGYEMTRQVAKLNPKRLVLIDKAETPMHTVRLHMAAHYENIPCDTIVSDICNKSKMEYIFAQVRPDYVFHAAAYKHVPMMEDNPSEAVQNNIYGTRVIADLAVKYGVNKFVMVSTDKAVNPTNVMGCSKRICEIYCQSLNAEIAKQATPGAEIVFKQFDGTPAITQFITTRFGNVLGSNGSVIPLFRKQIKQGGPLTVTHPDIIRFFMLIPEACRLVLEAGTMGKGGEIFIFDMGEPVRIADLAQRMIDLSGAKDVKIKFTGLRDGEKLYEEVLSEMEQTKPTPHPKIMVAAVREYPYAEALKNEEELYQISLSNDDMAIVKKMKDIVPEYKSRQSKYEVLD